MESNEARLAAMRSFVSQLMGTVGNDEKIHGSQFSLVGNVSSFWKLPGLATSRIQQFSDGKFYFMADFDPVDNGNPIY